MYNFSIEYAAKHVISGMFTGLIKKKKIRGNKGLNKGKNIYVVICVQKHAGIGSFFLIGSFTLLTNYIYTLSFSRNIIFMLINLLFLTNTL